VVATRGKSPWKQESQQRRTLTRLHIVQHERQARRLRVRHLPAHPSTNATTLLLARSVTSFTLSSQAVACRAMSERQVARVTAHHASNARRKVWRRQASVSRWATARVACLLVAPLICACSRARMSLSSLAAASAICHVCSCNEVPLAGLDSPACESVASGCVAMLLATLLSGATGAALACRLEFEMIKPPLSSKASAWAACP
jgi:hypothetical protein